MTRQAKLHILTDAAADAAANTADIDTYIENIVKDSACMYAVGDIIYVPGHGSYVEDGMCMLIYRQDKATKKMYISAVFGSSDDPVIDIPMSTPRIRKMLLDEGVKFNDILSNPEIDEVILIGLCIDYPEVKAEVIEKYTSWGLY